MNSCLPPRNPQTCLLPKLTMQNPAKVFLFAALPCEAKPLIAHFALKKEPLFSEFAIYRNCDYSLTVTGPGKAAMAAAVAYTLALIDKQQSPVILNIGIAGHQCGSLGDVFITEKITDADSGKNFYPQLIYSAPCPTATCCTVAKPHEQYQQGFLYDMEASAFYETAARFTSGELIQCIKVISDNELAPTSDIKPEQVSRWLAQSIRILETLIEEMVALTQAVDYEDCELYETLIRTWHFSVSERVKLKKLLQRRSVLINGEQPELDATKLKNGKAVLSSLEEELDSIDFSL